MKKILLFSLIGLCALSCKKTDDVTPTPTISCKLTQAVNVQGTYDFTYDAAGNIAQYTLTTTDGTDKQVLTHALTYNSAGQLVSGNQTFSINGKVQPVGGFIKYTYTNGLLTGQSFFETASSTTPFSTATIIYDANKRLTSRVYTIGKYQSTEKYEYDANGNCTRYILSDTDGYTNEIVSTYDTSKNPEQIIAKRIPFDLATGQAWKMNVALTTKYTFDDGTGPVVTTGKRTNLKTDIKGYVIGATYTDNGTTVNESYSLSDCN